MVVPLGVVLSNNSTVEPASAVPAKVTLLVLCQP
jgi:hypothetical protein